MAPNLLNPPSLYGTYLLKPSSLYGTYLLNPTPMDPTHRRSTTARCNIHTYTHTYTNTYTHIHTHIHTYIHIYTHTHTHTQDGRQPLGVIWNGDSTLVGVLCHYDIIIGVVSVYMHYNCVYYCDTNRRLYTHLSAIPIRSRVSRTIEFHRI
jgi:hypothetical protein